MFKYVIYLLLTYLLVEQTCSQCMSVYNIKEQNDSIVYLDKITTNMISYLYYDNNEVEKNISGYIHIDYKEHRNNTNTNENYITNLNRMNIIFTLYKIEEVNMMGSIDMSKIYELVYNNGYDGLILSSSDSKLTGEIMYFYYHDDTFYDIERFEVRESFLLEIMQTFPDGAYFDIIVSEQCNPYFNYWKDFFEGFMFHFMWTIQTLFSACGIFFAFYIIIAKWNYLRLLHKLCIILYLISFVLKIQYGVLFIIGKHYKQGRIVSLFEISYIMGSILSYSFSLTPLIIYISNFHLSVDIDLIAIPNLSRIVAIVASFIMSILTVIGVIIYLLAESNIAYYISYIYFLLMLIGAIIYYLRIGFIFLSIFNKSSVGGIETKKDRNRKKRVNEHFMNILIQNIMLILVVLCIIATFYIISPVQTNLFPCLICIFFNIAIFMQLLYFNKIKNKKSGSKKSSTTHKKTNSRDSSNPVDTF